MRTLIDVLATLRVWTQPPGGDNPFSLACRVEPGAAPSEIEDARFGVSLPVELIELWTATREAWLFEDFEYGQWGLHIIAPPDSAARSAAERTARPEDLRADDIVVGEFLGDQELLVCAPSEPNDRRYLVALPLDPRRDWYPAGESLSEVLEQFLGADGEKYWERAPR